jgi:hypothetical protein
MVPAAFLAAGTMASNPFLSAGVANPLAGGTRATVLLGDVSAGAMGRRVVTGAVVGYVERLGGALDVQLRDVTTWIVGPVPIDLEVLPPTATTLVRVAVRDTVDFTIGLLTGACKDGRSQLAAVEVPYRQCWTCGHRVGTMPADGYAVRPDTFCRHCARRLHLGRPQGRPVDPPAFGDAVACPACWCTDPGTGVHCPSCGIDRTMPEQMRRCLGRSVALQAVSEHTRVAHFSAQLDGLRWTRLSEQGWPQLVASVSAVHLRDGAPLGLVLRAPAPADAFEIALPVDQGNLGALLDDLTAGVTVRGAEISRVCPTCAGDDQASLGRLKRVLGRCCGTCGTRLRLAPHPSWASHWPRKTADRMVVKHRCGTPVAMDLQQFCTGCGDHTGEMIRPSTGRFANLDLETQGLTDG